MTNKEAIDILRNAAWLGTDSKREQIEEAVCMAINALTKEAWKEEHPVSPLIQQKTQLSEEDATYDCISRQAAIEAIKTWGLIDGLSEGQAIEILADEEKLPSAQPEKTQLSEEDATSDCISRQAAVELIKNYCENGCDLAEDNWCPSCQREQFIKLLKELPPAQPEPSQVARDIATIIENEKDMRVIAAQPEIIQCGQCKYAEVADKEDAQDGYTCQFHRGSVWFSGSYCSWAERRTDGSD